MKLDPFYLIVDSSDWIARLVPLGVRLVQLRIKDADKATLRREIRRARSICAHHDCQLIINDHWQLAIEEGCDFIHLGQEDLQTANVSEIRDAGLRLGLSTHDQSELKTALAANPDYIALGPVYPTTLKKMKWEPQGLARIVEWRNQLGNTPLVAIGGLSPDRLGGVFQAGAASAAVVSDITQNINPERRVREWIAKTETWR